MNKKLTIILAIICISLIILGVVFRILSLNKDFSAEEMDFVLAAKAINSNGHPLYYQAEQAKESLALWHPPMYIYVLSMITLFFKGEVFIRFLNMIFSILTAVLIYFFCARFVRYNGKIAGILASSLFLINFYVLSSSMLIDIDGFSTFFVFAFVFSSLLFFEKENFRYAILTALFLVFSLANRWPIAVLVYAVFFIYTLVNKKIKRHVFLKYFLIGLEAGVIFLLVWTAYTSLIEPGNFFSFIKHNASLSGEQFGSLSRYTLSFLLNAAQIIRLFTLPALLLFITSLLNLRKNKETYVRLIIVYVLSIFLLFLIVPRPAFGYPRYFFSFTPGFFIILGIFLSNFFDSSYSSSKAYFSFFFCLIFSLALLFFLHPQLTLYRNDGLIKATNLPDLLMNIFCSIPLVFLFLSKRLRKKEVLIFGVLALLLNYNLFFDSAYLINDSKIKDVAEYLRANTNSSDIIIAPKAVGFYYGGKYYMNDYYKPPVDKLSKNFLLKYIKESYKDPQMDSQFFWGEDIYGGVYVADYTTPDKEMYNAKYIVTNYLSTNLNPEEVIGNYYIYRMHL